MAALNTLRTKGAIVLTFFIGIALLCFLVTDGMGFLDNKTIVVGTVNNKDVSLQEYATEVDLLTTVRSFASRQSSLSQEESNFVQAQAWQRFISKHALMPSYSSLGLSVEDNEKLDMVTGENVSPIIAQIFVNRETGMYDKAELDGFIASLDYDAQMGGKGRIFWNETEKEMSNFRVTEKYNSLVKAGIFVTKLQIEQGLANNENEYDIQYVAKLLNTIPDDQITITDADLREYYNKHIKRFQYIDGKEIEYVLFDIEPSKADYDNAKEQANRMALELKDSDDAVQYVNYNSDSKFNPVYWDLAQLPDFMTAEKSNLKKGYTFEPMFEDDVYSISKINDVRSMPDSIEIRNVVVLSFENVDSLVQVVKSSKDGFDKVNEKHSLQRGSNTQAVKVNTGQLDSKYFDKLSKAKKGDVFTFDINENGIKYTQIIQVVNSGKMVQKYQIADVQFKVTPSVETEQDIYAKATEFHNAIVKDGKSFEQAVADNAYIKRVASLTPEARSLNNMENSMEVVRWAFTKEDGDVSHVINTRDANIVVYLKNTTNKGTAPFEDVKEDIRPLYLAKAKMDLAQKEIAGSSSLENLASKLGGEVMSANQLNFVMSSVPGMGISPEVIGALPSLQKDVIVSGIPTSDSAVAVKLTSKSKRDGIDESKIKALLETSATSFFDERLGMALSSLIDIKDNRVIYY